MSFQFGPPPDPDKDGIMECHHYHNSIEAYDRDGGLMDDSQLKHWFVLNACDVILGEDAMYKYSPRELFEKLEEISTSHEEYQNELECRDAADAHETFYPNICDV